MTSIQIPVHICEYRYGREQGVAHGGNGLDRDPQVVRYGDR